MKYELNKPYDFRVKDVLEANGILNFMVEVEGNLFPVKGYKEQIENMVPSSVSCRIMEDRNKNAYLIQNEAYLYPILYKQDCRYIFEVAEIRDQYAVLKDKHGIHHVMDFDGTNLSQNEIIVRCVEVVKDNDYKAHLKFYYTELVSEEKTEEIRNKAPENFIQPSYPPTIFEEDKPEVKTTIDTSPLQMVSPNNDSVNVVRESKIEVRQEKMEFEASVNTMLCNRNWDQLSIYFDQNLKKAKTPTVLKDVTAYFEYCISGTLYWETVKFLIDYDAHTFLGTIAKVDTSHIFDITDVIYPDLVDDIIRKSFSVPDKLKYALDLCVKLSGHLTIEQKNFVQSKCVDVNTPDAFFTLFKALRLSPDDAIIYLLSLKENIAAAFTIYQFYLRGKNGDRLDEKSPYVSLRPTKIYDYVRIMANMQSYPFRLSATLVNSNILFRESCPLDLRKAVNENGYEGFFTYVTRKEQHKESIETRKMLESLSKGDSVNDLVYKTQTDNYYILCSLKFGVYALLDKHLARETVTGVSKVSAKIAKVIYNKGNKVFIVTQKTVPTMYSFPPIIDNSTMLNIAFHEFGKGDTMVPIVKKLGFVINVELEPLPKSFDYGIEHEAKIVRCKDFFTYQVKIQNLDASLQE